MMQNVILDKDNQSKNRLNAAGTLQNQPRMNGWQDKEIRTQTTIQHDIPKANCQVLLELYLPRLKVAFIMGEFHD
jgi:hypothetical protein